MSSPRHGESALEAVDELMDIARESGAAAEVYGLESARPAAVDSALQQVDSARSQGLRLEADVVPGPRTGGGLGLTAAKEVPGEIRWPWVDFGSGAAPTPTIRTGEARSPAHGTFARVLGTWVRDERVLTLADAVRRMTSLPAEMLGLRRRGRLASGYYADVAVFDPSAIADSATSGKPAPPSPAWWTCSSTASRWCATEPRPGRSRVRWSGGLGGRDDHRRPPRVVASPVACRLRNVGA